MIVQFTDNLKFIHEYLNDLPEPFRSQALKNSENRYRDITVKSKYQALYYGFDWSDSPEGFEYWENFANSLKGKL